MNKKLLEASKVDRYVPALLVAGALISALGFVLAFTVAPLVHGAAVTPELIAGQLVANQLLFSQKIFYFHVPVAMSSFIALIFTAFYGVRYLMTRDEGYDVRAKTATEVAVVFMIATMVTGVPWTRFEWGVWWSWEPRLTTYLILILMAIAYFILRTAFSDSEKRCSYASVFGIIMFIDAPICFMITRLIPSSTHPVVFRTDSGLPPDMLVPFLICMLGIVLIAFALYRVRLRQSLLSLRIERLKEELDELE
ncbi:MAG: cytochrome c biogenesis protein CcsA [Coriobacteriales bacterium]|nr:cytochrome c biogenesis protein CcsA [Coriobacteriaceae bacterium]MDY2723060.1 cytochrome c biogenesis protein CcsA [Coriobacteriales bacterium]MDY5662328.1 cytochrome c biogenesis protein CcsA [Coriobacteriales bacterium]